MAANGHPADGVTPGRDGNDELPHDDEDAIHFLRQILDDARSQRRDLVTHYTVDDLRVALGFQKPPGESGNGSPTGEAAQGHPPGGAHNSPDPQDGGRI